MQARAREANQVYLEGIEREQAQRLAQGEAAEKAQAAAALATSEAVEAARIAEVTANAPAYEAGFAIAAKAYQSALKQGEKDLEVFVKQQTAAYERAVMAKGLKGEGEEGSDNPSSRWTVLTDFVQSVQSPTFKHGNVTVQVERGTSEVIWQDYLRKSIARNEEQDMNFNTDFIPEGEGDAVPGLHVTVTFKGKNTYVFRSYSDGGNYNETNSLSIAFGVGDQVPQEMESIEDVWTAAFVDELGKEHPAIFNSGYNCAYNPALNSEKYTYKEQYGEQATTPTRFDSIWPLQN